NSKGGQPRGYLALVFLSSPNFQLLLAEFPGIGSCMTHGCSSVRKMHMLLMRLNPSKYPIEQEEYPFLPVNLKANSMKMAQIMFETTFNAPVMNVDIKKDCMETLFSVVDPLCSQELQTE
ncbi:hypothetical protein Gogos_007801, partial [Gossypium gossypioides]|nr:hypothetical protein [Gossypium gossypioides]